MENFLLDANIIIRFLTNDDEKQSPLAYKVFEKAVNRELTLVLSPLIIAECTWVLQMKRYDYTKRQIAEKIIQLISSPGIKAIEEDVILGALKEYGKHNVDFIDAYLSNLALKNNHPIVTWNKKDFEKLYCEYYLPENLI